MCSEQNSGWESSDSSCIQMPTKKEEEEEDKEEEEDIEVVGVCTWPHRTEQGDDTRHINWALSLGGPSLRQS